MSTIVAAVVLLTALTGCSPRRTPAAALGSAPGVTPSVEKTTPAKSTPGTSKAPSPAPGAATPTGVGTVRVTLKPRLSGDLTIRLAGGCTWYQDSTGGLWLNPTLAATWTGLTPFPSNGFNMIANYGKKTAGGPVTSAAPFTWAIGGEPTAGNSFLGHTVKLTVTIDPVHTVAETNEANNTTIVTVPVPATPPPASGAEVAIGCS